MNEADTCRTYVLPKFKSAGWEDESITEQWVLTPGRIVTYLNGLHTTKVNALRELQSPALGYGDATQSPLLSSILEKAFKGEL